MVLRHFHLISRWIGKLSVLDLLRCIAILSTVSLGQCQEMDFDLTAVRIKRAFTSSTGMREKCLSPEALLALYGLEPGHRVSISPEGFMRICPAIVYQLDRRLCAGSSSLIKNSKQETNDSISTQVWVGASMSILVISLSGLLGVAVVPCLERSIFRRLLSTLVALAVGTLCGDALLHLLPHAYGLDDDHKTTMKSSATFLSLMGFFIVEALITLKQTYKKKRKEKAKKIELEPMKNKTEYSASKVDCDQPQEETEPEHQHQHQHSHKAKGIGSVAWMVISGDSLHNITDGLAVGAAFRADLVSGLATAVAVLTHELPHELGDFAVLLKSGMSVKQAVLINILSSVLSFMGMAAGVLLGNIESATSLIYCVTAGCFLYIGLADLVPELHKYRSKGGDVVPNLLLQLAGMFAGGGIMFLIALYEHSLHDLLVGIS